MGTQQDGEAPGMTWSIVARDPETGYFGIAIATRFFAVGALSPWTEAKLGALSTQATMNPLLGPRGLALLREGNPAPAAPRKAGGPFLWARLARVARRTQRAA